MRITGKLDYLEMPAGNGSLDAAKSFYSRAFGWSFVDYGPTYSAFAEGRMAVLMPIRKRRASRCLCFIPRSSKKP